MRCNAWAALGLLALFLGSFSGTGLQQISVPDASVESLLGTADADYPHPFTRDEYLQQRRYSPIGGIAFAVHDGLANFLNFVAMSDSMYEGLGDYAAFAGVRMRATTFVITQDVGVQGYMMTKADLQAINARGQNDFEIGGHSNQQLLGRVGLNSLTGDQVTYAGQTGMSYGYADAVIGGVQDSCLAWGIRPCRSYAYSHWQMMEAALPEIFQRHGFFQAVGLPILPSSDYSQVQANGNTGMQVDDDEWVRAIFQLPNYNYWGGFQRIGGMVSPYMIGSRTSWDFSGGDSDTTNACAYIDACAHSQEMGIFTLHGVVADGSRGSDDLRIEEGELKTLFLRIGRYVQAGMMETLTMEQAASRMRGIRDGNLMPTHGFARIADVQAPVLTQVGTGGAAILAPVSWPAMQQFYPATNDTFVAVGGTATNPKVFDLSVSDTLTAAFVARGGDADSVSWAAADTSRNVLLIQGTTQSSAMIAWPIVTTGVDANAVKVVAQVAFLNPGAVSGVPAPDGYMTAAGLQFEEIWYDFVNYGRTSYDMMVALLGRRGVLPFYNTFAWERERVRLVGRFDTADTTVGWTETPSFSSATSDTLMTKYMRGNWRLPIYTLNDRGKPYHIKSEFGNGLSLSVTGAALSNHRDNWEALTVPGKATEWTWYVPIDQTVDYIYFMTNMERYTDYAEAMELCILAIEAYPVR